jgi:hypothetical protein
MNNETLMPNARKSVHSLYRGMFFDMSRHLSCRFTSKDLAYLHCRIDNEGIQFLVITLPTLGRAIEQSLITMEPLQVPYGWRLRKGTRLPLFLNEVFSHLFDEAGHPRECEFTEEKRLACFFLRQVTLLFSKADVGKKLKSNDDAVEEFFDRITRTWTPNYNSRWTRDVIRRARELLERVFQEGSTPAMDDLLAFQRRPWGRNGPGAVSDKSCGSEKWDHISWPGLPSELSEWAPGKTVRTDKVLPVQPPSRVTCVPKDFRGPRVICIEPKENQFAQQGLMDILYRHIGLHPLTRRSISFFDTNRSQSLCYTDGISTIDLKDASDTISMSLARVILPKKIFALVTRYRTRSYTYKGKTVESTCLASMGNATCFPLETLIFWAIARSAMSLVTESFKGAQRRSLNQTLRVFGDDIIVPTWAFDVTMEALEACGFKSNVLKSCHLSPIKESCGAWTYYGHKCEIVKLKHTHVQNHRTWLHFRDSLSQWRQLACDATCETTRLLCAEKYDESTFKRRYNRALQRMEIRIPQYVTTGKSSSPREYAALYAWHVHNDVTPLLRGSRKLVKWSWVPMRAYSPQ